MNLWFRKVNNLKLYGESRSVHNGDKFCYHVFGLQKFICDDVTEWRANGMQKVVTVLTCKYLNQMIIDYRKMVALYRLRKETLANSQSDHSIAHSREVVVCSICGASVTRKNIAKHKRTNQACRRIASAAPVVVEEGRSP